MHCTDSKCRDETFQISRCAFEENEINYVYTWFDEDAEENRQEASVLFIKDARQVTVSHSTFRNHAKSSMLKDYLVANLKSFYD